VPGAQQASTAQPNFIALDRSGAVLVDRSIRVEGPPTEQLVTIYRGNERESWSCKPICQQRVTLGDGEKYFKSAMDQATTLSKSTWTGQSPIREAMSRACSISSQAMAAAGKEAK
jgi:hypothetical protein